MEKYLNFIKFGRVCFQDAMILNTIVAIPHILIVAYAKSGIALRHLKKWFDENYIEGYELDKDILVEGNRIYSRIILVISGLLIIYE